MNPEPVYGYRSKLSVVEDESSIFVAGNTFRYGFDKKSGLISHLEVLGSDFLSGMNSQIPDIYVSDARDPRESYYAARYEDEAECEVISANPYDVHIRTHGVYHNASGEVFPVRYRITYEIKSDGTTFVIVDNKAYDPCIIRWLCISRGVLNPSLCRNFSYLEDQSRVDTTDNYVFGSIPDKLFRKKLEQKFRSSLFQRLEAGEEDQNQILFSGRLIPWFWLGNDRTGVEICVWDVTHHRYGATQIRGKMIDPLGEVGANVSASISADGVLWEIFSLRNLQTPVKDGWEQVNYFALSITPPRACDPELAGLQVYHDGARRYSASYDYLSDEQISEIAQMGCNLLIGGVNWRSGEFVPDDEAEAKRVISTCHKHGIKIIPCISLMELDEGTSAFEEYGSEWRIEPVVEYEYETHLMCPGAEGWREHWRQQLDRIMKDYDFDGIYLDLWYDKLSCRNPLHGCQRRYMRPTFTWVRDMMRYARASSRTKDPNSIIIANTGPLPISMICSWLDVRSVGASQDFQYMQKALHSSYRLGSGSLIWVEPDQKVDNRLISLSLLYMSPILLNRGRSQTEIDLILQYWNVLRDFGVSGARWYPGFVDISGVAVTKNPDLRVSIHKRDGLLLTLVNMSPNEVRSEVSMMDFEELGLQAGKHYLIHDPISRGSLDGRELWSCDDLKTFSVAVPGYSVRLLHVREGESVKSKSSL